MFDVLNGKDSLKANVTVGADSQTLIYLGIGIFLAVTVGVFIGTLTAKKI